MKSTLRTLSSHDRGVFFVYGNYHNAIEILLLHDKFRTATVERYKVADFIKRGSFDQMSLFAQKKIIVVVGASDVHINFFQKYTVTDDIVLISAGDFRKSKKITEFFLKSTDLHAIAVFNKVADIAMLVSFLEEHWSSSKAMSVAKYIANSQEGFYSCMLKAMLLDGEISDLPSLGLASYLDGVEGISFIRSMQNAALKNDKWLYESLEKQCGCRVRRSVDELVHYSLEGELKAKKMLVYTDSMLYQWCVI